MGKGIPLDRQGERTTIQRVEKQREERRNENAG